MIICKFLGTALLGLIILQTRNAEEFWYTTKNFLPIKLIDVKYLHESWNFELRIGGKTCKFLSLYRSPSQNKDDFKKFLENLELSFDHMAEKNPFMMVALGDFYTNGSTNFEGSKIDFLTPSFAFHQIINKPTHILNNSSSCIDLIFPIQPK